MAEDQGAPEAGKLLGPGPEVVDGQKVAKQASGVESVAAQCRNAMRGILNKMTASTA